MALTRVTPDIMVAGGTAATYNSLVTTNEYLVRNNGRTFLHCKKTGANACTVTIIPQVTPEGYTITSPTVSIPATTGDKMIGPFPMDIFNDSNGDLHFTLSEVTGLTVAVVQIPSPTH